MVGAAPEGNVSFRPMVDADIEMMQRWLRQAHVQQWWKDPSAPDKVEEEHRDRVRGKDLTELLIIGWHGRDIGLIQRYRLDDEPEWARAIAGSGLTFPHGAGIDYAIGESALIGRGLGTAVVQAFSAEVFAVYPDVEVIVVTPQAGNRASCRVLEKAGYELVWTGLLDSEDPSDAGPAAMYVLRRIDAGGSST